MFIRSSFIPGIATYHREMLIQQFFVHGVKEPSAEPKQKVTAIFHCGYCAGSPERKPKRSGFPASATGWGEFLRRNNANSHSGGFLCGMVHKRRRVPTKIRSADGGNAGEHIRGVRIDFRLLERIRTLLFQQCLK